MVTYTQRKTASFDDAIEDIYGKRVSFAHTVDVRYDHVNSEKDGGIYKKIFETERVGNRLVIGCLKKYTGRLQINDDPDAAAGFARTSAACPAARRAWKARAGRRR